MIRNRPSRLGREPLSDTLLAVAHKLQDAPTADEALDSLTRRLNDRGIGLALLTQHPNGSFELERTTLPLAADLWGKSLRLPLLAGILTGGRPLVERDARNTFRQTEDGTTRDLLTAHTAGMLLAAPVRYADRSGVLCLVSPDLKDQDAPAVAALAYQLGAVLRTLAGGVAPPSAGDLPVFDDLTRRLSYSLSAEQIMRTGIEVLAPALGFQLAAVVTCRGDEDFATVYSTVDVPAAISATTASTATDTFVRLTGDRHAKCERPPFHAVRLGSPNGASRLLGGIASVLDAPLVTNGEVTGLLRVASDQPEAFDQTKQRTFFTVANQLSLALERAAAQQLAERAHLASLADSIPDGVVLIDASLRITSLNNAAAEQLASLGDPVMTVGSPIVGTPLADLAQEALSSQKQTTSREIALEHDPNGRRYLTAMAAPLANSPEGSAAVVVLRDVTDERLMQERLLQSEKMVSVGQLVSGVAHELNNPLTGIMGFSQLLLARDLDESTRRDIDTIYAEAERAAKIVQNLLSFARRRHADKEIVNLNVLLERVLELRNYDLRVKNIQVDLDLDPKLPETMVDANQIQQVFLNVIINAEQAMLAEQGEGKLTVQTRKDGNNIRITFRDSGPGMNAETLRRIFDPFFTTKDTGEGTGLGLTICYGIIEAHGGRIWAESEPGRGSTFVIELPILQGREGPAEPEAAEPEAIAPRSILVVDDEESIQRLLGSILQLDGHQVETARNGVEALELLKRRRFDVVITDIKMPDMDGRELFGKLVEHDAGLAHRTIFITGDTVSPDTRTFLQKVNNPCLTKPFRVRDVRETIAQLLAEAG